MLDVYIRNNYESKHAKKELRKELGLRADSPPLDKRDTNIVREYQPAVGSYDLDSVYARRLRICCQSMWKVHGQSVCSWQCLRTATAHLL